MNDTLNDTAWNSLFPKYNILDKVLKNGFYEITSKQINEFRQARLMTKFDFKTQLPKIFSDNKLSILPVSRGSYIISDFDTFKEFESNNPTPIKVDFPNYLESIKHDNITSESTALNCAFVTGILEDFIQDEQIKPTVSGRMSSSSFDFKIKTQNSNLKITVNNSQIEIDGGYEGINTLSLIEAKNSISKDFLIRQIFYPYKLWNDKINKKVKPIFLTYSNGIFHFREYVFEDPNHYNSLILKSEKKYIIRDGTINRELIKKITYETKITKEPNITFPQADSFDRVINICELLAETGSLTREEITLNYDFNVRQTNYYTDAGRYLGLISKSRKSGEVTYFLTELGERIFKLNINIRQIEFIKLILSYKVFNLVMKSYFENTVQPDNNTIAEILKKTDLYSFADSTFYRRSSTISSWINWIFNQIEK
ncbi:MAG: transcriptional regulator [Dysgonamonadaceae bacterium]|nr:transcriptional regulator [Dysgonamonadaceae bacterium]MDD4727706.1 transcriptional regulator [Dysgonamonadaceae bacterium]